MLLPVRAAARSRSQLGRCASSLLVLALLIAACATPELTRTDDAASSAPPQAGSGASADPGGGVGGQPSEPTLMEGGACGTKSEAGHPSLDTPSTWDPDYPEVVEPGDGEPEVVEPEPEADGLPCDLKRLLRARCQSCHGAPPVGGALVSLLTYADLTAPSKTLASVTVAARSLQRMNDGIVPMPPAPASHLTPAEIVPLQAWLAAGLPRATGCQDEPGQPSSNPYDAAATCTSGSYWTANDTGAPWMMPGAPCIACHRQYFTRAPLFTVAGTVFPTAHEPDKCHGVTPATGATVVITDANGKELSPIPVASRGNFGMILSGLALPYRAKVVVGNRERVMLTPQTNGDCNACHTQAGSQGAQGRVIVP